MNGIKLKDSSTHAPAKTRKGTLGLVIWRIIIQERARASTHRLHGETDTREMLDGEGKTQTSASCRKLAMAGPGTGVPRLDKLRISS